MHAAQTRRDGDQLTDARYETADERRDVAFLAKISFCALDLLAGEQAHMSQTRVGELIDHYPSEPHGETIVDDRADHGS